MSKEFTFYSDIVLRIYYHEDGSISLGKDLGLASFTNCAGELLKPDELSLIASSAIEERGFFERRANVLEYQKRLEDYYKDQEEESRYVPTEKVKKDKATNIYLVRCNASGYYKIGISKDVNSRFSSLRTGNPNLELIWHYSGFTSDEEFLHELFEDRRVSGEWFVLDNDDIVIMKNYLTRKAA